MLSTELSTGGYPPLGGFVKLGKPNLYRVLPVITMTETITIGRANIATADTAKIKYSAILFSIFLPFNFMYKVYRVFGVNARTSKHTM